ncbi:hypothetical protein Zmor_016071 [Zophobas morio]|uniref:HMG box domain-containing protein n=1 Tax=Zophobas morio TaxID=2755281 RepID=A0AA38MHR0_9CUCU|nr:hypothetical protein Zmor_016071 [Zophobas morio]
MNAFIVWARPLRGKLAEENPQMKTDDISKRLATVWRQLSEAEKRPFIDRVKQMQYMSGGCAYGATVPSRLACAGCCSCTSRRAPMPQARTSDSRSTGL